MLYIAPRKERHDFSHAVRCVLDYLLGKHFFDFLNLWKQTLEIQIASNKADFAAASLCLTFKQHWLNHFYNLTLELVMPELII